MADKFLLSEWRSIIRARQIISRSSVTMRKLIFVLLLLILIFARVSPAHAQTPQVWSSPSNISRSGAASQPRVVATADGKLQAFWWDRFDGLMSAATAMDLSSSEPVWSDPFPTPVPSRYLEETPYLVADAAGWVHAFWLEPVKENEGVGNSGGSSETTPNALMHSELRLGGADWSFPEVIAESAVSFVVASPPSGGISVGYIRTKHTADFPAGVYVKHDYGAEAGWGFSILVYASIYYRLLSAEQAQITLADRGTAQESSKQKLYLAWFDPHLQEIAFSMSEDSGQTWSQSTPIRDPGNSREYPRLASNGYTLLIWQDTDQGGCALYQQALQEKEIPSTTESATNRWGSPQRIFEGLSDCPTNDQFIPYGDNLLWLCNEGSSNLTIALWDQAKDVWSKPLDLSFGFKDPETHKVVSLNDLHATLSGEALAVVGADDSTGEVWFTQAKLSALGLTMATPATWNNLLRLSDDKQIPAIPVLSIDGEGRTHLVWSPSALTGIPGTSLEYAQVIKGIPSRSAEILASAPGEIAHQPDLLYDPTTNMLQLVWTGGQDGSIQFSQANINDASGSAGWFAPQNLSGRGSASSPQIAQDAAGILYVLYIVPLNEGRGVYIVRSDDHGESWTSPRLVFDAAAASWPMVEKPELAVGNDGVVHIAWVQAALPGMGTPMGIFYAKSSDQGEKWTEPLALAGPGYNWPRLALSGEAIHLLYAASDNGIGVLLHRQAGTEQPTENAGSWSNPSYIPGWSVVALPFGLAGSGAEGETITPTQSLLHLVGADPSSGALLYSFWDGEKWSARETLDKSGEIDSGIGISAFSPAQGGTLAAAWLAVPVGAVEDNPALYFTSRIIPSVELPVSVRPTLAVETPTAITPVLTIAPSPVPSPTPDLNQIAPATAGGPISPMVMGGIFVAIILAGIFGGRYLINRIRIRSR